MSNTDPLEIMSRDALLAIVKEFRTRLNAAVVDSAVAFDHDPHLGTGNAVLRAVRSRLLGLEKDHTPEMDVKRFGHVSNDDLLSALEGLLDFTPTACHWAINVAVARLRAVASPSRGGSAPAASHECYQHLIFSERVEAKPGYIAHEVHICTVCGSTFWIAATDLTERPRALASRPAEGTPREPSACPECGSTIAVRHDRRWCLNVNSGCGWQNEADKAYTEAVQAARPDDAPSDGMAALCALHNWRLSATADLTRGQDAALIELLKPIAAALAARPGDDEDECAGEGCLCHEDPTRLGRGPDAPSEARDPIDSFVREIAMWDDADGKPALTDDQRGSLAVWLVGAVPWRSAARPQAAAPDMAFAWLIEDANRSGPWYWGGVGGWTTDHMRAIRYVRAQDAEAEIMALPHGWHLIGKPVEHGWAALVPASSSPPGKENVMRTAPHKLYLENPHTLLVTVEDPLSGEQHQVRVNPEDYERWVHGEAPIQHAFPYLNADEREILMTGLGPRSWDKVTLGKKGDQR